MGLNLFSTSYQLCTSGQVIHLSELGFLIFQGLQHIIPHRFVTKTKGKRVQESAHTRCALVLSEPLLQASYTGVLRGHTSSVWKLYNLALNGALPSSFWMKQLRTQGTACSQELKSTKSNK